MQDISHATEQDNSREAIDLATAADILNIKADTLRKRLRRGQMEGYRNNQGKWLVYLPDTARQSRDSRGYSHGTSRDEQDSHLKDFRQRLEDKDAFMKVLAERLADKEAFSEVLQAQLREKDRLISQLVAKLPDRSNTDHEGLKDDYVALQLKHSMTRNLLKQAFKLLEEKADKGAG